MNGEGELVDTSEIPVLIEAIMCPSILYSQDTLERKSRDMLVNMHVHIGDKHIEPRVVIPEAMLRRLADCFEMFVMTDEDDDAHFYASQEKHERQDHHKPPEGYEDAGNAGHDN